MRLEIEKDVWMPCPASFEESPKLYYGYDQIQTVIRVRVAEERGRFHETEQSQAGINHHASLFCNLNQGFSESATSSHVSQQI